MAKRESKKKKAAVKPKKAAPVARPASQPVNQQNLSSRHQKTLEAIFEHPVRPDIPWRDIEKLFEALGGLLFDGEGSRVRVKLGERKAIFHEPHPDKVTDKGAVASVRKFLESAGVQA